MNRKDAIRLSALATLGPSAASAESPAPPSAGAAKPPLFPDDEQFWFETLRAFGSVTYGGAEFGEVLQTSARITPGDYDSWYDAWNATADRIAAEAREQLRHGRQVSARDSFLRASNYYRSSEFFLREKLPDPRVDRAYQMTVESYHQAATLFDPPILPIEIPYEHTTLPGYFHRVDASSKPRPTLIVHTGFDGAAEEMHFDGARAAVERGYNVLAFDGPGQFGPIHRQGLPFRPDWERVVTPVVDFVLEQPGVDPKRIGLMGESMGGELAPRAAAFEKRIAALIADDGVYDYAAAFFAHAPPERQASIRQLLVAEEAPQFDRSLAEMMKSSPTVRWALLQGMYTFAVSTPRKYLAASLAYTLAGGIAERITCPTLVCDAQNDQFFHGQPETLYAHLTCPKTLMRFTTAEGAGDHCQEGAKRLAFGRIYDWLDATLSN